MLAPKGEVLKTKKDVFRSELRHYPYSLPQPTHRMEQNSKSHGEISTSELENKAKDTMPFEPETNLNI
jgi:hypothetical protein